VVVFFNLGSRGKWSLLKGGSFPTKLFWHKAHFLLPSEAILIAQSLQNTWPQSVKTRFFSPSKISFQLARHTEHSFFSKNLMSWFVSGLASMDCLIWWVNIAAGWLISFERSRGNGPVGCLGLAYGIGLLWRLGLLCCLGVLNTWRILSTSETTYCNSALTCSYVSFRIERIEETKSAEYPIGRFLCPLFWKFM